MTRKIQLYVDLDGVLAAWTDAAIMWYNLPITPDQVIGWNTIEEVFINNTGKSRNKFWRGLTHDFWAYSIPRTPEFNQILDLIHEHRPTVLTHAVDPVAAKGKAIWIRNHLPEYFDHRRYMIMSGRNKAHFVNVNNRDQVLIDDYEINIDGWNDAGGSGVLVPRPYNSLAGMPVFETIRSAMEAFNG